MKENLLTYLVACFVGFLQPDPPLIIKFDAHTAATVGVFAHPAEELLQVPPQRGVLLPCLRVTWPRQESLCRAKDRNQHASVQRDNRAHIKLITDTGHSLHSQPNTSWDKNKSFSILNKQHVSELQMWAAPEELMCRGVNLLISRNNPLKKYIQHSPVALWQATKWGDVWLK